MIEQLPLLIPDAARRQRVSRRCHEVLSQQRRRIEVPEGPASRVTLLIERAIVAGLCVIYVSSAARDLVRLLKP